MPLVRILALDQFDQLGGGQQCLMDLVRGLAARGFAIHAGIPGRGPLAQHLENAGATVHSIPLTPYTNGRKTLGDALRFAVDLPRLSFAIRDLVRRHSIDLVYVNAPRVLPAAALATERIVFHAHSLLTTGYAQALATQALRGRAARVIASSNFVARPLVARLGSAPVQVVYNGVPDRGGLPRDPAASGCIGILGRVAPEKGHLDFLRMARSLQQAGAGYRFLIGGDGQHSSNDFLGQVRRLADGLPVEFVPWQADIRAVLNRLELLIVPSQPIDATPRVIPEALSAGVPVVAYRLGGIPELIDEGGGGILVPAGQPEELARVVRQLLAASERVADMRLRARQVYERRFTVERYVREIATVLESELGRFSRRRRINQPAESAINPATASTQR